MSEFRYIFFCEHSQRLVRESQSPCLIFHKAYFRLIMTKTTAKNVVWKTSFSSSFVTEWTVVIMVNDSRSGKTT